MCHYNSDKSTITTCIAKYENAYMLYDILAYHWMDANCRPLWACT